MNYPSSKYKLIVIGCSAGGIEAISQLIPQINPEFRLPIIIVQHIHASSDSLQEFYLDEFPGRKVRIATDKDKIEPDCIYLAPPNYHLLVNENRTLSLSIDASVNYSRPSIDVLFESAANAYGDKLVGVVLTGANSDGSEGLKAIKSVGGLTVVQDPQSAESSFMPQAAINQCKIDYVLGLNDIADLINHLKVSSFN